MEPQLNGDRQQVTSANNNWVVTATTCS